MPYSAITIQGNIFTSDLLEKIRSEDIRYQHPADFGLDKPTSLRDEIGIAWAAAKAHWQAFRFRRERLKDTDTGTFETRQGWMLPFMRELGYELEKSNAEIINGKSYAISHRAVNRHRFPIHIVGINQSLDKRAEIGGTRLSPHALVQEYLNNHDHLYALVSNGRYLRLLRDATRLSRLSFLECDLERMNDRDDALLVERVRDLHRIVVPVANEDADLKQCKISLPRSKLTQVLFSKKSLHSSPSIKCCQSTRKLATIFAGKEHDMNTLPHVLQNL